MDMVGQQVTDGPRVMGPPARQEVGVIGQPGWPSDGPTGKEGLRYHGPASDG